MSPRGQAPERHSSNSRRRGDKLTDSIYAAVIEILRNTGYGGLTFQEIARAAKTSRTVLYRRWETPFDLVYESIRYKSTSDALSGNLNDMLQDTGSLRGDLLLLLKLYQNIYNEVGAEMMNIFLFEMSQNNDRLADIKRNAVQKNAATMRKLLDFAKKRGETVREVSDTALVLPFNLVRAENMLRFETVDEQKIEKWVDEILLPVFKL
ncbi:MAG: TetR/AcrR family transcriptional regulator [Oscillospiraceae bacterium]|nr:TetR/AcrR family transcriptional regulator [Oscillospiraceae bacterium]